METDVQGTKPTTKSAEYWLNTFEFIYFIIINDTSEAERRSIDHIDQFAVSCLIRISSHLQVFHGGTILLNKNCLKFVQF